MDTERYIEPDTAPTPLTEEFIFETELAGAAGAAARSASPLRDSLRRFARDKRAMGSLVVLLSLVLASFFLLPIYEHIGPVISERHGFVHLGPQQYHNPSYVDNLVEDQPASSLHWLGTNFAGQDIFARLLSGIQVSLFVAVIVVGLMDVGLGILFGVLAGYYGGIIDTLLARFTDLIFAFPGLLFAVLVTALFRQAALDRFGNNGPLYLVAITLGLTIWPQMARYVRGQTLQLKEQQYIEASRTIGTSSWQIITRHVLPNILSLIFVAATLDISGTIINEGVLSLIGLGVQAPGSSLGLMIQESLSRIPYFPMEAILPSITLTIIVLSFSFIGDGLRDAFDPRSKD